MIQAVKRRFIRVTKPVRIEFGGSWAEFRPYDGTRFEIEIDFDTPLIGHQVFASDIDGDVFRKEIARARTFGFMKDVEKLWASGHALGSSLDNSIVIGDDDAVINTGRTALSRTSSCATRCSTRSATWRWQAPSSSVVSARIAAGTGSTRRRFVRCFRIVRRSRSSRRPRGASVAAARR